MQRRFDDSIIPSTTPLGGTVSGGFPAISPGAQRLPVLPRMPRAAPASVDVLLFADSDFGSGIAVPTPFLSVFGGLWPLSRQNRESPILLQLPGMTAVSPTRRDQRVVKHVHFGRLFVIAEP